MTDIVDMEQTQARRRDPFAVTRNPVVAAQIWAARRRGAPPAPPGPSGRPVSGGFKEWRTDPFHDLQELHQEYGDVVHVPMPLLNVVSLNHPDHVAQIMADKDGGYSMIGPLEGLQARLFGAALPGMEGQAFRERRKLLAPMFGRRSLSAIADVISAEFAAGLSEWEKHVDAGEEVDLQHEIARLTLPAFVKAMYSTEVSADQIEQIDQDLRLMMRFFSGIFGLNPLPLPVPLLPRHRATLAQAHGRMRAWVNSLIDARVSSGVHHDDLLQVMIDARYEDGTPISRKDLGMEMIILTAGGYETVVASLSWTLALLDSNPAAQQRLYDEVDALDGKLPAFEDLDRLVWAKACFDEGQRLQGHPFHPRFALKDAEIGGFHIPKGTLVGVPMYALHRDPRWWGETPDVFDPHHFFDKQRVADRPNLAFIPFGAGQHRCIGSAMAYMNSGFLMALIHQRYRVHLRPGWTPEHDSTFSCTIKDGLPVTLTRTPVGSSVGASTDPDSPALDTEVAP